MATSRGADASDAQRAAKRQKRVDGRKQYRTWEASRTRLEAYRDAHGGDCNVPRTWKDDPQLGKWVVRVSVWCTVLGRWQLTTSRHSHCVATTYTAPPRT